MPPITIFGRPLGGTAPARSTTGMRVAPGGASGGSLRAAPGAQSKLSARQGYQPPAAKNAGSQVYSFKQTITAGNTYTQPLNLEGDSISATWAITTVQSSSTVSVDALSGLSRIDIIAPDGTIMSIQPSPDFYSIAQRFGPYGVSPAVVNVPSATVTTSATNTVQIPINLPASKGPYSLLLTAASLTNQTNVTVELGFQLGNCDGHRSRFQFSNLGFTPSASGTNDLAPILPILNQDLQEIVFTGMTSNTADIAFFNIQSAGSSVTPRLTGGQIVALDTQYLSGSLSSTIFYPLLALQTTVNLTRESHIYTTFGASPSSSIRLLFCWSD